MTQPLPQAPVEYNQQWASQLLDQLERTLTTIEQVIQSGYQTNNVTDTRVLDADSTTLAEVADVLCTLIEDMKAAGRLGD